MLHGASIMNLLFKMFATEKHQLINKTTNNYQCNQILDTNKIGNSQEHKQIPKY